MRIEIKSQNFDCGAAFRKHVEENLTTQVAKYFENIDSAQVFVSHDSASFRVTIQLHIGKQTFLQAHGSEDGAYRACDSAILRIKKRLRRLKRRIRSHSHNADHKVANQPTPDDMVVFDSNSNGASDVSDVSDGADHENSFSAVVAEMSNDIATLPMAAAVNRFDSSSDPVLVFRRRSDQRINLLYRRPDGAIGWVDPRSLQAAQV